MSVVPARILRVGIAAVLAGVGLVAVGSGPASAAAVPCQRTYGGGALAITDDGAPTFAVVDVPEDGLVVSDVDVSLDIDYADPSDLHIEAQNWDDGEVTIRSNTLLFDREGGVTGADFVGTVFDDEATVPITWGDAPFTGRFMPRRPLAELEGLAGGKYVLLIAHSEPVAGTLVDWSFTLTYASCDFDSDGVEDHRDRCLGVTASTATGCPLTTRALTAKYRLGKFKGALSSPVAGCKANRGVTVWKVRSGADRKIGTATSASDGRYKLTRAKRVGKYYATSPRVAVIDVAECPAVTSPTFRIR